jgi:ABC-type sulfate transport system substrate-binding protein
LAGCSSFNAKFNVAADDFARFRRPPSANAGSLKYNLGKSSWASAAKAYLTFLFSDVAQETIARLGYRQYKAGIAEKVGVRFPQTSLVPVTAVARDLNEVNEKFFAENGIIDAVMALRDQ